MSKGDVIMAKVIETYKGVILFVIVLLVMMFFYSSSIKKMNYDSVINNTNISYAN